MPETLLDEVVDPSQTDDECYLSACQDFVAGEWEPNKALYLDLLHTALRMQERLTALASLQPSVSEMRWQPIESAPKDGTRVLLWLGDPWSEGEVASWYEPWENWQTDRHFSPISEVDEYSGIGAKVPTHWMPLPAPPALSPEGEP